MQALNFHRESGPWDFTSSDVQSQMHSLYSSGQDKSNETCFGLRVVDVSLVTVDGKAFRVSSVLNFYSAQSS